MKHDAQVGGAPCDIEADPAYARAFEKLIDRKIAALLEAKRSSTDEQAHMARWLIATLLAINSGGLVFLASAKPTVAFSAVVALSAFVLGLAFAMLNAYLIQIFAMRAIGPIEETISYWTIISKPDHENPERLAELKQRNMDAQKLSWTAPLAGWISMVALIIGVVSTGYMMSSKPPSPPSEATQK